VAHLIFDCVDLLYDRAQRVHAMLLKMNLELLCVDLAHHMPCALHWFAVFFRVKFLTLRVNLERLHAADVIVMEARYSFHEATLVP